MTVADWPSYLLRGIPADTRAAMTENALRGDISLADVIRQALCHRYHLDCDLQSYAYQPQLDSGNDILIVRVQPEVWKRMKKETRGKYGRTKQLILESIDDYLKGTQ